MSGHPGPTAEGGKHLPRLIAWEVTRSCILACKHCRAAARPTPYAGELTTAECFKLLDNIASFAKPIIILTGGEPMLRPDIYDIAKYACGLGLPVVMAPCGVLIDDASARKIVESGIRRISISLDGATAASHDSFRQVTGSFEASLRGIEAAKRAGLDFQINTTITQHNMAELPEIMALAIRLGASVFNPFLLVPTGRGKDLAAQELSPQQYEQTLEWLADRQNGGDIQLRVTCAPHYQRILRQKHVAMPSVRDAGVSPACGEGVSPASSPFPAVAPSPPSSATQQQLQQRQDADKMSAPREAKMASPHAGETPASHGHPVKGCMGGQAFAFISHVGKVQICGFLDVECGDVKKENFDFRKIWETSEVFRQMRDVDSYHGRCGVCEFGKVCGGCRARASAVTGDYLAEEPFCTYQPRGGIAGGGIARPPSFHSARRPSLAAASGGVGQGWPPPITSPLAADEAPADLDDLDGKILSIIQTDFPVDARPFDVIAARLGVEPGRVLAGVAAMRGVVIRRIGAVFDSRSLGYASTLVAARIPPDRLDQVARLVSELPGVTHNYGRQGGYNLWCTLTAPSAAEVDRILADLRSRTGIADFHSLPAITVYKVRVDFQMDEGNTLRANNAGSVTPEAVSLSDDQKRLVRLLQEDLPQGPQPFDLLAAELGQPTEQIIEQIAQWIRQGVIRRFGAVVNHRRLGFVANGMAVFQVAADRIDAAGRTLAQRPEVSHCYRRPPLGDFDFNLFAMVHGRSESLVRAIVDRAAAELNIQRYDVLFSTAEYKKVSMKYFTEPTQGLP
jgi:radical SAM protein with 4Fe4S-binding SPASM domain